MAAAGVSGQHPAHVDRVWTIPNLLSMLRLVGVPVFLWAILSKHDTLALVLLMVSGFTDYLDGKIARTFGMVSKLGEVLDPIADRLYIFATLLGLGIREIVPWWLIGVIVALWAARGTYRRMLKAGIELYEFNERILHAKTGVIDGAWVTVGSSNLDALSLRKNLEVNAFIHDPALGAAMERLFAEDIAVSERMTLESVRRFGFWQRLASWVASHFRQWL